MKLSIVTFDDVVYCERSDASAGLAVYGFMFM